jgi:hypothetical protein
VFVPPSRVRIAGWVLYVASWGTPNLERTHFGAGVFLSAPRLAWDLLRAGSVMGVLAGFSLLLGWLANFSLWRAQPVWAHTLWVLIPWLPFVMAVQLLPGSWPSRLGALLYFFPWALGIALFHLGCLGAGLKRQDASS